MNLRDKLAEHKRQFEANAPPQALEVMHRATADLRNSGIMERVLKVGQTAPVFELENADRRVLKSTDWLANGPLVIAFYRGLW